MWLVLALTLSQAPASLPHLEVTDEHGQALALDTLKGRPVVLTMGYSKCKVRCPMVTAAMKKIEATFVAASQPVTMVMVSLDPRDDTPEQLEATKKARGLSANWRLFSTTDAQVTALTRALGVKVSRDDEHIDHEARVFVYGADGAQLGNWLGWKFDLGEPLSLVQRPRN